MDDRMGIIVQILQTSLPTFDRSAIGDKHGDGEMTETPLTDRMKLSTGTLQGAAGSVGALAASRIAARQRSSKSARRT